MAAVPAREYDELAATRMELSRLRRIMALGRHGIQSRMLELMERADDPAWSPKQLADVLDLRLGTAAYHVRCLARDGLLELAGERRVRGAVEHFYRLADRAGS